MRDTASKLLAAYNARDADTAAALYEPDGEHRELAQGTSRRGREALRDSLEGFLRAFPDARWHVQHSVSQPPLCAVTYRLTGTLSASLGPFQPAGQGLEIEGVLVIETDAASGRIVRTSDYWDSGTFARQMRTGT